MMAQVTPPPPCPAARGAREPVPGPEPEPEPEAEAEPEAEPGPEHEPVFSPRLGGLDTPFRIDRDALHVLASTGAVPTQRQHLTLHSLLRIVDRLREANGIVPLGQPKPRPAPPLPRLPLPKLGQYGAADACAVCLTDLGRMRRGQLCSTPCGHVFCRSCLEQSLAAAPDQARRCCPLCRAVVG